MIKREAILGIIALGLLGSVFWYNVWGHKIGRGPFVELEEKERSHLLYDISLDPNTNQFRLSYRNLPSGKFFLLQWTTDMGLDRMAVKTLITGSTSNVDLSAVTEIPGFEGQVKVDTSSLGGNYLPYFLYQLDSKKEWWQFRIPPQLNTLHTGRTRLIIYKEKREY